MARWAARTARSTCSSVHDGTRSISWPSKGDGTLIVSSVVTSSEPIRTGRRQPWILRMSGAGGPSFGLSHRSGGEPSAGRPVRAEVGRLGSSCGARGPFLDHPGPIPFAHRGGAGDWPENTMPAFERRRRARLPLRRDRRARHRRRRAAGLPRRPPRPGHRPHRRHRRAAVARGAAARVDGREPIPLLEDLLGTWPDAAGQHRPQARRARSSRWPTCSSAPTRIDRVCVGAFSDRRLAAPAAPARARRCAPRSGPRASPACAVPAVGVPTGRLPAPCAQVPHRAQVACRWSTGASSAPPTTAACRCTCGRSTIPTRWTGCSTSASTAS